MPLHLHAFLPAGKHYVQKEVFPSDLLSCWQERLPDRKTEGMKDHFQDDFPAIRITFLQA
jgi:hypothetical protein